VELVAASAARTANADNSLETLCLIDYSIGYKKTPAARERRIKIVL
jgi:hypothetical protein